MNLFQLARYGPRSAKRTVMALAIVLAVVSSIAPGSHSSSATSIRAIHYQGGPGGALLQIENASERVDLGVGGPILDMLQTTISPDVLIQTPVGDFRGEEGLDVYLDAEAKAFPSATYELLDLTVDGDITTIRWRITYQDTMTFVGKATLTQENGTVVAINVIGPNQATAAHAADSGTQDPVVKRGGVIHQ